MQQLQKFNERVDRLQYSKFIDWISTPGVKAQGNETSMVDWLNSSRFHRDEFDGFILNFRFLIQDRDGFSIRSIKKIYDTLRPNLEPEKRRFDEIYKSLKSFMSKKSIVQIKGKNLTNQTFFEIIFYGGIAHENANKVHDFMALTRGKVRGATLLSFTNIITVYLENFIKIRELNKKVLTKTVN